MENRTGNQIWRCCDKELQLGRKTLIMGILNVTPDSFSDGNRYVDPDQAAAHALEMQADGADIIDIGGESSRPGASPVSEEEELKRVIPVIEKLHHKLQIPISIDTYKSAVARQALKAGAVIVNDISGLHFDEDLANIVAGAQAGLVLMHIKGTPRNMQLDPQYNDLMEEICTYLQNGIDRAVAAGVNTNSIVVDPGIGFGKRLEHNFQIIRELEKMTVLNHPILIGPSRKSFIGNTLNVPVNERLEGTAAAVTAGILNGAHIVRIHDVKEMKRVIVITDAIRGL